MGNDRRGKSDCLFALCLCGDKFWVLCVFVLIALGDCNCLHTVLYIALYWT